MHRLVFAGTVLMGLTASASATEIQFVEDFALAPDRNLVLKLLIPGTEDFYYFHALHYLNTEQFEKARELFAPWHQRHGQTGRLTQIQTRLALLSYEKAPNASVEYLRQKLGLTFPHQREQLGVEPSLPTKLDANLISRDQFIRRADGHSIDNADAMKNPLLTGW